jgi:hypothetical protein
VEATPEEERKRRVKELFNDLKPYVRKIQEYQILEEEWANKCGSDPSRQPLMSDVHTGRPILSGAIAILMKITKGEITIADADNTNALLMLMDQIDERHKKTESWAITYKVMEVKKRGSVKRKIE